VLRFDGVESLFKVWVNGDEIGSASGSRLAHEFDVTPSLYAGDNVIAVRVHQWSAASYLEDQDQWWRPGIFRDVTLVHRPAGGLEDVWLRTSLLDGNRGRGRPSSPSCTPGRCPQKQKRCPCGSVSARSRSAGISSWSTAAGSSSTA
jgi:hypothetical protein